MSVGKRSSVLIRFIVAIGTLNFELRLQRGTHTVQNTLGNPTREQRCNLRNWWQFAFTVQEGILDFTEQIFWQIKGLL